MRRANQGLDVRKTQKQLLTQVGQCCPTQLDNPLSSGVHVPRLEDNNTDTLQTCIPKIVEKKWYLRVVCLYVTLCPHRIGELSCALGIVVSLQEGRSHYRRSKSVIKKGLEFGVREDNPRVCTGSAQMSLSETFAVRCPQNRIINSYFMRFLKNILKKKNTLKTVQFLLGIN